MANNTEKTPIPHNPNIVILDLTHLTIHSRLPMRLAIETILRGHNLQQAFERPSSPDGFSARFFCQAVDTPLLVERSEYIKIAEVAGPSLHGGEAVYEPAITFRIHPSGARIIDGSSGCGDVPDIWRPFVIQFPFVGGKILGSESDINDVSAYCEKWAVSLLRKGYHVGRVETLHV